MRGGVGEEIYGEWRLDGEGGRMGTPMFSFWSSRLSHIEVLSLRPSNLK